MRYDNGKAVKKNTRLWFPYCGYKKGFCLKIGACHLADINGKGCRYYRQYHPVMKLEPQAL